LKVFRIDWAFFRDKKTEIFEKNIYKKFPAVKFFQFSNTLELELDPDPHWDPHPQLEKMLDPDLH
jgi:hypothetical protein